MFIFQCITPADLSWPPITLVTNCMLEAIQQKLGLQNSWHHVSWKAYDIDYLHRLDIEQTALHMLQQHGVWFLEQLFELG
jgi:hypothetical protein